MYHWVAKVLIATILLVAPVLTSAVSADPSPTVREPGLLWTLADLDPTKRWVVQVDGRVLIPVMPGSSNLFRFVVDAPGPHTLTVQVTDGGAPMPISVLPGAPPASTGFGIIR